MRLPWEQRRDEMILGISTLRRRVLFWRRVRKVLKWVLLALVALLAAFGSGTAVMGVLAQRCG